MFTFFRKPEDSKELFFALSNSLQIVSPSNKSSTHKFAGLYAIYKGCTCYYVGQSQNLASRISQHLSGKYVSCDRVDIYFATDNGFNDFYERCKESRKAILETNEMMLIKTIKPIENLITPDSDFSPSNDKLFYCFYEEFYEDPSVFINAHKGSICVSKDKEPVLVYEPLMRWHNEEVLNLAEQVGFEIARENVCHG